jgi:hypothetical protein
MRVEASQSIYHESPSAVNEFDRTELKYLRQLLRRLRFLERKVRETGGMANADASGGASFAEWEMDATAWVLDEIGFLAPRETASV